MERGGARLLSERELSAREREEGRRLYSLKIDGGRRLHRCDLIATVGDGAAPEAIEVELHLKGAERLDLILRSWRRAVAEGRFGGVVYHCSPRALAGVKRAVERTATGGHIRVEEL
jgi:hypothetical protein